jgi:NitT/TauT family transport system substrate-binding protein
VISTYVWLRRLVYAVGVKPDSPIKRIEDLAGKRVGIRSQGDAAYPGVSAMLSELGVDPKKSVEWLAVGSTAPAGEALYRDRVDALAIWDAEFARIESAGFKLRYLENSPGSRKLFGGSFGVNRKILPAQGARLGGLFRALAKSTVFAYENPSLAIRMHWDLYPESKPKGKTDEDALKDAIHTLNSRKDKWFAAEWQEDKRIGGSTRADWQVQVDRLGLQQRIPDVGTLFTNELIPKANDFDRQAVVAQARAMRL